MSASACLVFTALEPEKKRIALLGTFPPLNGSTERSRAIVRIEKTSFAPEFDLSSVVNIKPTQSTDIVCNFHPQSSLMLIVNVVLMVCRLARILT